MIVFDSTICNDFSAASSREWLETNGLGGFASGTISGANTRRYHGVFTPATEPPLGRITMVSKIEETITIDDTPHELSANRYPGRVHPEGFQYLKSFRLDPFPIWSFEVDGVDIEKTVFMPHGQNVVVCTWRAGGKRRGARHISLELRPLLSFVDYHHLRHDEAGFDTAFTEDGNVVRMMPERTMPGVFFHHADGRVVKTGYWYRDFEYAIELERGFDYHENLYQPFSISFDDPSNVSLVISTDRIEEIDIAKLERSERRRRSGLARRAKAKSEFARQITLAADQFIVSRGEGHTIIAGYPWFSDWGRDTMIALNGLTLTTNRPE
ncbi:MAG TPA: glycogen debranching enzyme N-terminal domain-containing protein, partial [Pyrinomonadaceae bacterium]|nr:glycogen debranching enzyme N-terminal domain-containing protein [Pyrinomonadaceae bacterium]